MQVLEVCVDSVASARAAEAGGANRLELCSGLSEGGLTPSLGLIRAVRANTSIALHVLIRPRGGDFVYSNDECEVMRADIAIAAEAGAQGVVLGLLTASGEVDVDRTRSLVAFARPMEVTFHRAIDITHSPLTALQAVIASGADRVLTSGGQPNALLGHANLRQMVATAKGRIRVLVGGGVRPENLGDLLETTGASEWHSAARRSARTSEGANSDPVDAGEQLGFGSLSGPIQAEDVRKLRQVLDAHDVRSVSL